MEEKIVSTKGSLGYCTISEKKAVKRKSRSQELGGWDSGRREWIAGRENGTGMVEMPLPSVFMKIHKYFLSSRQERPPPKKMFST